MNNNGAQSAESYYLRSERTFRYASFFMKLCLSERVISVIRHFAPLTMGIYILHPLLISLISHFIALTGGLDFIVILLISYAISLAISRIKYLNALIKL